MEKDNELLEKQLENDEDLLDFDLDDLTEIEFDEESPEDGDIIELVDLVEEGEEAVENVGEEIAALREEEPSGGDEDQTQILNNEESPLSEDLTKSDFPDEFGPELDMALSDLELAEESVLSEDGIDSLEDQDSIESEIIDEEEIDKDLEILLSDDEIAEEMVQGDLEEPVEEAAAAGEVGEFEELLSEDGLSEETPLEDREAAAETDLSFEEPVEEAAFGEELGELEGLESEEEKPWESDIETIQEEKAPEDEAILSEEPLFEEDAQVEQGPPDIIGISEEKIEAMVKTSVEDVLERVARETMGPIAEKVARETMTAVAERVIGEAIEALKRSLDSSTD